MKFAHTALILITLFPITALANFRPLASETITESEITTPGFTENISGDAIWLCLDTINGPLQNGDEFTFTLSGGAMFANGFMLLEEALGGAGTGGIGFETQSPADATGLSSITFAVNNASGTNFTDPNADFRPCDGVILSGDIVPGQNVDFSFANPWSSTTVEISASLIRASSTLVSGSVKLFDLPALPAPAPAAAVPTLPFLGLLVLGGLLGLLGIRQQKA